MEQADFIEKIADKIADFGLVGPAVFLLEAHRPLAFVGSQLLLVTQPTFDLFLPQNLTRNMADLLADPDQLELLITSLEHRTQNSTSSEAGV